MTNIIITDTHFGIKQNSMTWFNSQSDFIYNQLIPYIKNIDDEIRLIHMGDVFDSRSTLSVYIANKVRKMFIDIKDVCEDIIILAGNHDFYSPNSDEYDSLNIVLNNIKGITLVRKEPYFIEDCLFIPWYKWNNVHDYINENVRNIFAHTDIVNIDPNIDKNIKIFSGHMHRPFFENNRYNIGSCYSLDFADANGKRGFYKLKENLEFIENQYSIRFWRLYDNDIFDNKSINDKDYIELYISVSNMTSERYIEKINEFTRNYKNIWVIPQISLKNINDIKFNGYDIKSIIKDSIPDNLIDKFKEIQENYHILYRD